MKRSLQTIDPTALHLALKRAAGCRRQMPRNSLASALQGLFRRSTPHCRQARAYRLSPTETVICNPGH